VTLRFGEETDEAGPFAPRPRAFDDESFEFAGEMPSDGAIHRQTGYGIDIAKEKPPWMSAPLTARCSRDRTPGPLARKGGMRPGLEGGTTHPKCQVLPTITGFDGPSREGTQQPWVVPRQRNRMVQSETPVGTDQASGRSHDPMGDRDKPGV